MSGHASVIIIFSFVPTFLLALYIIHTVSQWRGDRSSVLQKLKPCLSAQVKTCKISATVAIVSVVMFVTVSTDKGPRTVISWAKL